MTTSTTTLPRCTAAGRLTPAFLACLPLLAAAPVPTADTPREVIERVTDTVTRTLLDGEKSEGEKREIVQALVDEVVDFDTVSKLVLARNWKRFSAEQRSAFRKEFERHLMNTYWRNASSVDFERIDVVGEQKEPRRDWTVKTRVIQSGDSAAMNYRLRRRGEGEEAQWKVIDIVVEDVSLVSNFRSQFQSIVAEGGPDRLIELLRKKNAAAEKEQAAAEGR